MDERIATTLWTSESDEGRALLCGAGIPFVAQAFMPAASTLVSTFGHTLVHPLPHSRCSEARIERVAEVEVKG